MNARSNGSTILLREVEPGEWWMEMPRITCEVDERLDKGIDLMEAGHFDRAVAVFARLLVLPQASFPDLTSRPKSFLISTGRHLTFRAPPVALFDRRLHGRGPIDRVLHRW